MVLPYILSIFGYVSDRLFSKLVFANNFMIQYSFIKYNDNMYQAWNSFIEGSKNATFIHNRDYMDYHSHRFTDYSLMIYNEKKLVALLPANTNEDLVASHQGLTYGGLLFSPNLKFREVVLIFNQLLKHLNKSSKLKLQLAKLPNFYSEIANDELDYLFYLCKARVIKKQILSVVNLKSKPRFSKNRLEGYKRGIKHKLDIKYDDKLDEFWEKILIPNLKKKYQSKPVHSLEEIQQLKNRFPNNIVQVNIYYQNNIVAGTTLFLTTTTIRSQYISGNPDNNKLGSLDFLFYNLIENYSGNKQYFDFGSSMSSKEDTINSGLLYWKEGLGGRSVIQNFYEVDTKNYNLLDTVMS